MNHESSAASSNSALQGSDLISRRAYELWEKEGRPEGSDLRHWLQAEQELGAQSSNGNGTSAPSAPPAAPINTGSDVRPLEGTRAASAANRPPKRGSNSPFGERSGQGNANSQPGARRR